MGEAFSYEVNGGENLTDHWLTPPELIKAAGLSLSEWIRAPMRSSPGRRPRRCTSCPSRTACCFPGKAACSAIHRMAPRSRSGRAGWRCTDNGLLLVFARTETLSFRPVWTYATAILFFYSRIRFIRPEGGNAEGGGTAPSVLAAFGHQNIERLHRAKQWKDGAIVTGWLR
jgi:hypothetical protein